MKIIDRFYQLGCILIMLLLAPGFSGQAQSLILVKSSPLLHLEDSIVIVSRPVVADIDGDSDLDIFIGDEEGRMTYFVNTADLQTLDGLPPAEDLPGAREWKYQRSQEIQPFDIALEANTLFPTFVDLDKDGDLDLFGSDAESNFVYFENRGTSVNPKFSPLKYNPFGLVNIATQLLFPTFADMDNDGDLDLMTGNGEGVIHYWENTGTEQLPNFGAPEPNPFGLDTTLRYAAPGLADLDSDGDIDLLVGGRNGRFHYYENTGDERFPDFDLPVIDPLNIDPVNINVLPAFTDLDRDGDLDMLIVDIRNVLFYYENVSVGSLEVDSDNPAFIVEIGPVPARSILEIRTEEILKRIEIRRLDGWPVKSFDKPENEILLTDIEPDSYLIEFTNVRDEKVIKRFSKER